MWSDDILRRRLERRDLGGRLFSDVADQQANGRPATVPVSDS